MDDEEREAAHKLSHIKTFDCDPLLIEFYQQVDETFENTLEEINKALPIEVKKREKAIKLELSKIEKIISKLDKETASILCHSMEYFKKHVSTAHHRVIVDFISPFPIEGLTK